MKKTLFLVILAFFYLEGYGQLISGTILDKETGNPITYATIYFEGTSVATFTDTKGNFILDTRNRSNMPLTVSALGYYSLNINDYVTDKPVVVHMIRKVIELDEISVAAKGDPKIRKRNLEIFKREFLGRTKNAGKCEIANENDIKFVTSANSDTIRAYSLNPLIIKNRSLGYNITYYLDKFEYIKSQSINQLIGDFLFLKDTVPGMTDQLAERNRNYAYFGSKMHFFRSLWQKGLKAEGFIVKAGDRELTEQEFIRYQVGLNPENVRKYVYYSNQLPIDFTISYVPAQTESSMTLLQNNIYFSSDGYFKGHNIIWQGEMALPGIADLLPYDFIPTCEAGDLYTHKIDIPLVRKK
jgi:hypothetical protein